MVSKFDVTEISLISRLVLLAALLGCNQFDSYKIYGNYRAADVRRYLNLVMRLILRRKNHGILLLVYR